MNIEDLKEFKPRRVYIAYPNLPFVIYRGERFFVLPNPVEDNFMVISTEKLSIESKMDKGFFLTPVNVNDVEEYGNLSLYCKF